MIACADGMTENDHFIRLPKSIANGYISYGRD